MIVLGADTHKRSHTITAVATGTGESLGEGNSTREAIRCLKRYLARHVWRLLQPPTPLLETTPPTSIS